MKIVTIYGTVRCSYCHHAEKFLQRKGVTELIKIDIEQQPDEREKMVALTGRRTVPQIFIGETHVGGYDDLLALDNSGRLAQLLTD